MNYQTILVNISDRIAVVTINRPDKLNAVNLQVIDELKNAFQGFENNPEVGVVILTGAGEKAFVAGSDIGVLSTYDTASAKRYSEMGNTVLSMIQNFPKPVIAAVNGFALGSGCEIAMACHIRIASENAKFGQPEVNLGLIPGHGGTQRLARIVGIGRAMEITLTGNTIDANEAFRIGLVNKVVPLTELKKVAEDSAKTILSKSPAAISLAIKAINSNLELPLDAGLKLEAELFSECFKTKDFLEGTKAFLEKRKPVFKGK
ncbi:MAG: enoyl-CoA hydratase/isomerase family protein [Bacteroidetes bacterium]|nr:enoyl-CoA hydratase/isomerase family protein [Bacteroidota bacterium]MBU1423862.1 enoyl-CoA hydratase/isomerase family protein [Bacteroidota bacterium]MBU2471240.1 enoyl-CoA hydratase/isomerase family protein [Bacteroidota bacterium]MBU2635905.1 enoyl-CoA hydratase/isomerase family protein [Bacteroidota bacterium]